MPGLDDVLDLADTLGRTPDFFFPGEAAVPAAEPEHPALIFRAVASQLAGQDLSEEIDRAIAKAERAPTPQGSFRPRADDPIAAAQELLSAARATEPPIDVDELASLCGARVIRQKLTSDSLSGFLLNLVDGPVIGANAQHSERRRRFTIAHELGHLVLGHHADYHVDLMSSVSSGEPPGYDWRHERAANNFAANLLMPAGLVRRDVVEGGLRSEELAERYAVSTEAMGIRLSVLGLT